MQALLKKSRMQWAFVTMVFVYSVVLLFNDGFIALDEYFVGITRYIPAQSSSLVQLVQPDDVKSPLQLIPMHVVAQAALALGVQSPYWQYRVVIAALGFLSLFLLLFGIKKYSVVESLNKRQSAFVYLLFTFYFAAPFALTRPMFESVASPWLLIAAVYALSYDKTGQLRDLLWGVFFGSVAFCLRQQLGFCALVFVILPVLKKQFRHLGFAAVLGLLFFVLSGLPDLYLRGQFHYSLLNLTIYNYKHGSDYGNQSIFFYPVLIFVMCFVPFLIKRYPTEVWSGYWKKNRSLWLVVFLFVFLHSLFPQKWERFVISVIPILLLMVFPFLFYLQSQFAKNRLRLAALYAINFILFFIASFFPAQKNLIEMSRYLGQHPEIKFVHRVSGTPEWITEAFILNKQFSFVESSAEILNQVDWSDCSQALVLGQAQYNQYESWLSRLHLKAVFNVNLIEQWAFSLNPDKNLRRVQLKLLSGCQ